MSSVAPVQQQPVRRPEARPAISWSRVLHRVGGLVGGLLMLWIACTGIMMQLIDLKAIFTHEPQTTATQLSIQEGMYGPANYAVIQLSDFNAPTFPKGFDINQGIATVLQAAHTPQNQVGAAGVGPAAGPGGQGPGVSGGPRGGARSGGADRTAGVPGAGGFGGANARGAAPGRVSSRDGSAEGTAPAGQPRADAGGGPGGGSPGGRGGPGQQSSEDRVAAIDKVVTLTADQKNKIKAIYDANQQKAADIRASQDPDMRTKLAALRADQDGHIAALMTADQKPKYEAYLAAMPQGRGAGSGAAPGGDSGARAAGGSGGPGGSGGARTDVAASGPGNRGIGATGSVPVPGGVRGGGDGGPRTAGGPGSGGPGAGGPGGGGRQGGGGQSNAQLNPMAWVELRMINGAPVGQVMLGTRLEAFNAVTGASVTPIPPVALPQGRALPPSLRQKLKTLHRFWNRSDTPGVYVEFLAGLFLMMLIVTGLVMYFRLLGTRVRQGRRSPLWLKGGGWWRGLHRVVSVLAAAFIFCIAFSGTWIGFESSYGPIKRVFAGTPPRAAAGQQRQAGQAASGGQPGQGARPAAGGGQPGQGAGGPGGGRGRRNPIDFIIPLRDAEVQDMTATTLTAMHDLRPEEAIKAIRLRIFGQVKQGAVISTDGDTTNQYVFDADTGALDGLTEQGYPMSNFPFGVQTHENMKHFHSGAMFGVSTRVMNLLSGFSLTFLSISGLVMYFDMWRKRRRGGRTSLFWA